MTRSVIQSPQVYESEPILEISDINEEHYMPTIEIQDLSSTITKGVRACTQKQRYHIHTFCLLQTNQ